jgi:hypothetical protein
MQLTGYFYAYNAISLYRGFSLYPRITGDIQVRTNLLA